MSIEPLSFPLCGYTQGKSIPCFPSGRLLKGKFFGDNWLLFISFIIGDNGACAKGEIFPRKQKACMWGNFYIVSALWPGFLLLGKIGIRMFYTPLACESMTYICFIFKTEICLTPLVSGALSKPRNVLLNLSRSVLRHC